MLCSEPQVLRSRGLTRGLRGPQMPADNASAAQDFRTPEPQPFPLSPEPDRAIGDTQVRVTLRYWLVHFTKQLKMVAYAKEVDVTEIGVAGVARGILGRPDVHLGGKTVVYTKKPMPNTDTKKYVDMRTRS
eukprot:3843711-Prymnesium_polylepis.1